MPTSALQCVKYFTHVIFFKANNKPEVDIEIDN